VKLSRAQVKSEALHGSSDQWEVDSTRCQLGLAELSFPPPPSRLVL